MCGLIEARRARFQEFILQRFDSGYWCSQVDSNDCCKFTLELELAYQFLEYWMGWYLLFIEEAYK